MDLYEIWKTDQSEKNWFRLLFVTHYRNKFDFEITIFWCGNSSPILMGRHFYWPECMHVQICMFLYRPKYIAGKIDYKKSALLFLLSTDLRSFKKKIPFQRPLRAIPQIKGGLGALKIHNSYRRSFKNSHPSKNFLQVPKRKDAH